MIVQENSPGKSRSKMKIKTNMHIFLQKTSIDKYFHHKDFGIQYQRDRANLNERCLCRDDPPDHSDMNARGCQMRQPPEEQKEDEQQTIHAI
jgi:hypothetical protein